MPASGTLLRSWLITAVMAAVIVYGSLYPFDFRIPANGIGPLAALLATIGRQPGRGDAIANVMLYMPFGFFFVVGLRREGRRGNGLLLATLCGALLSLGVELTQYYDAGRVTTFSDFATNTAGTLLGGLMALVIGARVRLPFIGEVSARPIPTLLLVSWLGYRLYPYVPAIDLHKYWNALKPIVLTPSLTGYDLFRQTALWMTTYALLETIVRRRWSALLAPLFAIGVLCAKIAIVGATLRLAEPVGAGVALAVWLPVLWLPPRLQAGVAVLVLCGCVVAQRLEPFTFLPIAHEFGWIPFRGLMRGSLHVDTQAALEKFFLYGSMIYLLGTALGRRLPAVLFTAAVLFATSWTEAWLPGRSAEITDTLIALIAALVFSLFPDADVIAPGPTLTRQDRRLRDWQREQARVLGVKPDR